MRAVEKCLLGIQVAVEWTVMYMGMQLHKYVVLVVI